MSLDLYIYDNMLKILRQRQSQLQESLCFGSVPDFTAYKEQRAVLAELATIEQELKNLLERVKDTDE
jgi:hypothetical protein|tara:strand:- start:2016 stop:2216 length:201 start_codon:yes stop_codon:yes gene_type:complete